MRSKVLTLRQKLVLEQMMQGHCNKIIARNLDITESTVKVHIAAILVKLDVSNRVQACIQSLVQLTEPLIRELPEHHTGRNGWLSLHGFKRREIHRGC